MLKIEITAPNLYHVSDYFKNIPFEDDKTMASFDVISLYTNISLIDTLNKFKDCVNKDDQENGYTSR